jgi:ketosteroid isomerase-like protein
VQWQQKQRIGRLFGALVQGQLDDFVSGCSADLVLTVRGSHPAPVILTRSDIPDWYGSLQALSPGSLRSSVEVAQVKGDTATVILRHHFARNGTDYRLEMVNHLAFRHGLLAEWSSYPLDLPEYSRAWRANELSVSAQT